MARTALVLGCALIVSAALGCERADPGAAGTPAPDTEQPAVAPPDPILDEPRAPAAVIAERQAELPHLTVQVRELARVDPSVLKLRFSFANTSSTGQDVEFGRTFAPEAADVDTVAGVHLIDAARQKKYFVLRAADGSPLCSGGITRIGPGERVELWADFPAPPQGTRSITVRIPRVPPITGVPIT